jgi:hypothetical protein
MTLPPTATNTPTFSKPTNTQSPTETIQPTNTETQTPTSTQTISPTITPTLTVTAIDTVLAETGYDIANISVIYPREDIMHVDFQYRLKEGIEDAMITMQIPTDCRDHTWYYVFDFPNTTVEEPVGSASIEYKLPVEGECAHDSFYINIHPITKVGQGSNIEKLEYQEKINLPFSISRVFPTVNSDTLTVKNFRFESTGSWKGNILFDYILSEEIPLDLEKYYFSVRGIGGAGACKFQKDGEILTNHSGIYLISVSLPDDIMGNDCTEQFTSYLFNDYFVYFIDQMSGYVVYYHSTAFDALFVD